MTAAEETTYGKPSLHDVPQLTDLLQAAGVTLVGQSSASFLRHVLLDAIRRRGVSVIVARCGDEMVGWTIAVIQSRRYWARFVLKHPVCGLRIMMSRLWALASSVRLKEVDVSSRPDVTEGWHGKLGNEDDRSRIATHVDITVLAPYRRRGIAKRLYAAQFRDMAAEGVTQVNARIEATNLPSIQLHQRQGWGFRGKSGNVIYIAKRTG